MKPNADIGSVGNSSEPPPNFNNLPSRSNEIVEWTHRSGLLITPMATRTSSSLEAIDALGQVRAWCRSNPSVKGKPRNHRGGYDLPSGDKLIPDVSYIDQATWDGLTDQEREKAYIPCVPAVVVELLSETDDFEDAVHKMQIFTANQCPEALLVDTRKNMMMLFKPGQKRRPRRRPLGSVSFEHWPHFTLDCQAIKLFREMWL